MLIEKVLEKSGRD